MKFPKGVDAVAPLTIIFKPIHFLHCRRRDPEHCAGARAIGGIPGISYAQVYLLYTWVTFEDGRIVRYSNDVVMRQIAEMNDTGGRRKLIDEFKDEFKAYGGRVKATLLPPRPSARLQYLRSKEHREARNRSKHRRRVEIRNGAPKRRYTKPSAKGLRNGSARHATMPGTS